MAATQHIRMKWLKRNRWLKSWFKWINSSRCLRMMWGANIQWAVVLWANMTCWVQRWITRLLWAARKATLTHTVATKIWRASLNTQHINLKQQKTTLGATSVSHEQETEAIIHTTSLQLDNRRLEKHDLDWWFSIFAMTCNAALTWLNCMWEHGYVAH